MVANLDIGPVQCADGQCSVQRQLHITGSRRLHAGGRDLLREIRRGHDYLREGNIVILQKRNAQLIAHFGVRVDGASHVVDELDDGLGHRIARSRLAGEDHGARHDVGARILANAPVTCHDVQ